uniref:Uncharacterized protein n=1 Tax=Dulem virus 66 TaxID=3145777 RepID=A0AAU8AV99_9VIRU
MKKFLFWLKHVFIKQDALCGGFCPTCAYWDNHCQWVADYESGKK